MTAILDPTTAYVDPWDLDLTITHAQDSGASEIPLPSGKDCDSGDGCGQTCDSACTNSGC